MGKLSSRMSHQAIYKYVNGIKGDVSVLAVTSIACPATIKYEYLREKETLVALAATHTQR